MGVSVHWAPRPGTWRIRTFSSDADLHGWTGTVEVEPAGGDGRQGFLTNFGSKWGWAGSGEAFVPQYVMGKPAGAYLTEAGRVDTAAVSTRPAAIASATPSGGATRTTGRN